MRCPACGHSNNDLATRCSACGSPLSQDPKSTREPTEAPCENGAGPEVTPTTEMTPPTIDLGNTAERVFGVDEPTEEHTAEREPIRRDSPQPDEANQPKFREVKATAGKYVSAKRSRLLSFLQKHQRALGVSIALTVIVAIGVIWLLMSLSNGPAIGQIETDLAALLPTYSYSGGTYGPDLDIPISKVNVTRRESTQSPTDVSPAEGVGPGTYQVDAELLYDDGRIQATHNVSGTYVRSNDGWLLTGELNDRGTSLTPESGVDEAKVLEGIEPILSAASKEKESLNDIYQGGSYSISGNDFEPNSNKGAATNAVTIHCERKSDFFTYTGSVTANFAFESGTWQLTSAEADDSATSRTYDQLVGTWTGRMVEHEADGGSCFGAREYPVSIVISSVGDSSQGSGQVQGTISCLGHYHERLNSDKSSTEGDTVVEDLAFRGIISAEYNKTTGSSLNIECSSSGEPRGKISFVLSFGTSDDPSAAIARVTTMHEYEERVLLVLPRQTTARFTDTYVLSREE